MSDPSQHDASSDTPPGVPTEWARSLDAEAMRRRIGERLFGDDSGPTYLGRFKVLRTLGVGGMGVVHAAEDDLLHRVVALKLLRDDVVAREGDRQRILREARALARLSHPNVVQLYEVVTAPQGVFLVMEYVDGMTLSQWLRAERRSVVAILAVFAAVGRGLAAAHRAGIVHRDVKPGNILIGDDGRVRIVDLGLARGVRSGPAADDGAVTAPASASQRTPVDASIGSGTLVGTPAYMAPEAFLAGEVDARSDQFSFCVALYESLYGNRPFGSDALSGPESLRRTPSFPTVPRVPVAVRRMLARGLSARPADRFPSMNALTAILERRPRSMLWALVGVLAVGLIAGVFVLAPGGEVSAPRCADPSGKIVGIWDPPTRESVRRAILRSAQPFAARAAEMVAARLDEYVAAWRAAHWNACEATRRGEQSNDLLDRRMGCLEQRRFALAGLVEQLRRGDPHVVAAALDLTHELPDLAACSDPPRLLRSRSRRVDEPQLAAVRSRLLEAMALNWAREEIMAASLADAVLREVRAIGDARIESEALRLRGRIRARELGELEAGLKDLHAAVERATEVGDDSLAANIWVDLAEIAAMVEGDVADARLDLDHAREAAGRHGRPAPVDEARLLDMEAVIGRIEGNIAPSLQLHERALELRREALPADHPEFVRSRLRVAHATDEAGDHEKALALVAELRRDVAEQFGEDYPVIAVIEVTEAQMLVGLERYEPARERLRHARPLVLRSFGARTPVIIGIDLELAAIDAATGELPRAIGRARGALQLATELLPPHHNSRYEALVALADYYHRAGDCSGVVEIDRQLLSAVEDGRLEAEPAVLLYNLGDCMCRLGRCSRGQDYFMRLLALNPEGVKRALALYGIGLVHVERGQAEIGLPALEEARELLAAEPDALPFVAVDVARILARALEMLHREPRRVRALRAEADALARELAAPHAE